MRDWKNGTGLAKERISQSRKIEVVLRFRSHHTEKKSLKDFRGMKRKLRVRLMVS